VALGGTQRAEVVVRLKDERALVVNEGLLLLDVLD